MLSIIGIALIAKCLNNCVFNNNIIETAGLYFSSSTTSSFPKTHFFITLISNSSTREFISGLQQNNFSLSENFINVNSSIVVAKNNINDIIVIQQAITSSILRIFQSVPNRLVTFTSSTSNLQQLDPRTQSTTIIPILTSLFQNKIYSSISRVISPTSSSSNLNDGEISFFFIST